MQNLPEFRIRLGRKIRDESGLQGPLVRRIQSEHHIRYMVRYDTPSSLNTAGSRAQYGHYGLRNIRLWSYLLNDTRALAPELIDPDARFQQPEGVVRRSFCSISGLLPSEACSQAGLVKSDLFNAKYVPTKTDDSLLMSRYVMVNGKKYLALPNTPAEFSQPGVILNPDFVKTSSVLYLEIQTN